LQAAQSNLAAAQKEAETARADTEAANARSLHECEVLKSQVSSLL
jgi:hypothetical protein